MVIRFYHVTRGLESRFSFTSPVWFYRSKYERWFIVRFFGIYWWFHEKPHYIFKKRGG